MKYLRQPCQTNRFRYGCRIYCLARPALGHTYLLIYLTNNHFESVVYSRRECVGYGHGLPGLGFEASLDKFSTPVTIDSRNRQDARNQIKSDMDECIGCPEYTGCSNWLVPMDKYRTVIFFDAGDSMYGCQSN